MVPADAADLGLLLILGVIGLALDFIFRAVNRRLFRWADTTAAA